MLRLGRAHCRCFPGPLAALTPARICDFELPGPAATVGFSGLPKAREGGEGGRDVHRHPASSESPPQPHDTCLGATSSRFWLDPNPASLGLPGGTRAPPPPPLAPGSLPAPPHRSLSPSCDPEASRKSHKPTKPRCTPGALPCGWLPAAAGARGLHIRPLDLVSSRWPEGPALGLWTWQPPGHSLALLALLTSRRAEAFREGVTCGIGLRKVLETRGTVGVSDSS